MNSNCNSTNAIFLFSKIAVVLVGWISYSTIFDCNLMIFIEWSVLSFFKRFFVSEKSSEMFKMISLNVNVSGRSQN